MAVTKRELYDVFEKHETRYGTTIHREIVCDWDDAAIYKPSIGQLYPGERDVRCTDVTWSGVGKPELASGGYTKYEAIKFVCEYSTAPFVESAPVETWEFSGEVLETGLGRIWMLANEPVESTQGIFYPTLTRNVSLVVSQINATAIFNTIGKVNCYPFQGFAPETLLMEGATCDQRYDYERNQYSYTLNIRMIFRAIPHNYIWRAPKQAIDPDTDAPMVDADGYPVYLAGLRGVGAWDRPVPALYEWADFNPVFNLTPNGGVITGATSPTVENNPQIPWLNTK